MPLARDPFAGPGEMAERMRHTDWAATPVGPVERWPQGLRATVRTLLGSRYPMVLLWGEDDLIQIYNDAYTGLIGAKHPYALGRSIKETQAESWDIIGPMIREVMATGTPNWVPAQCLAVNRAGYDEEAYFSLSYSAVEDDEGSIRGMLCVCSEVTAQILVERRLKLQRDIAARVGEARDAGAICRGIGEAIAGCPSDIPFALLYLREGEGFRLAAAVGLPAGHPGAEGAAWPLGRTAAGEAVLIEDAAARIGPLPGGPFGQPVQAALTLPLAGSGGAEALGVLVCGINPARALDEGYRGFYDLLAGQVAAIIRNAQAYEDERRRAQALAELDRAKTRFFANVSHEFRTPLTLLLGPVEDLLARPGLGPELREELAMVRRNALRLLRLVNSLLDFARVEAGRAEACFVPVELGQATAELAGAFRSAIERAGLRLDVDCPPLAEPAHVDPDLWEKVVFNLLSNAFKHTFEGRIAVRLRQDGAAIRLTVEDSGIGIPADQRDRVFERFHRIEGARSRTHEGSGIGLSLVRELVGLHGGRVSVESEPGRGAAFTVEIPAGHAHLPPERIGAAPRLPSTALGAEPFVAEAMRWVEDTPPSDPKVVPMPPRREAPAHRSRVVLADDNADMRAYVARLLAPEHEVVAVPDGAAALAALRATPAELLLTDVMMPVMDGLALLRAVRADPALRTLPVVVLSARAGEEASSEGLEAGADDYLAKPFSARELRARIRTNLELARLRREAEEQAHQARKMEAVGQLTGGVAHDFNNLLAAILGSLDLAERRVADERVLRLLRNAMQAARRGAGLTAQLLAFARRQRLEARPTDLNRVLSGMGDLLHRTLGGRIGVSLHLAKELWPAMADAGQLELAVLNLAINARDAMPEGGELSIETCNLPAASGRGDRVAVAVRDTGTGMPPEVLERVFEPFFTTKGIGKGTGLGLAQVHGTISQLGGEVAVESRVGEGSLVRLMLPRALDCPALEPAPDPGIGEEGAGADARTVLLVDDDPQVRTSIAAMLRELGHRVVDAESGREALHLLRGDARFDLLLSDHAMPAMAGGDLAVRARALHPGLSVLIMTGYAGTDALPVGNALLRKPFDLAELRAALRFALEGQAPHGDAQPRQAG
ncbi:response regulator [Belnapia sp. T18]|uniref:histidine kinase n=1 Tax=Belnapia arida TaxID=2804533 RepID=A0ABS1U2Y0_9PROT|nr:ATP-binding protein [Belnapia arida]MBL6079033.1 response regulator [Belnapia arida]